MGTDDRPYTGATILGNALAVHIQLDTFTEQSDSLLSVLGKIEYALDTQRRKGENNASINWILLITTAINTGLIVYILRLTKNDNDKGGLHD